MGSNSSNPVVHIWVPDCQSVMGGIQIFSKFFIRAVGECLPEARLFVFSKNDRPPLEFGVPPGKESVLRGSLAGKVENRVFRLTNLLERVAPASPFDLEHACSFHSRCRRSQKISPRPLRGDRARRGRVGNSESKITAGVASGRPGAVCQPLYPRPVVKRLCAVAGEGAGTAQHVCPLSI